MATVTTAQTDRTPTVYCSLYLHCQKTDLTSNEISDFRMVKPKNAPYGVDVDRSRIQNQIR